MTHTLPQLATATKAVAICLAKDGELPVLFLHFLWHYLYTYVLYLCLFWSVSLIMWSGLSGDTEANNTPGEEKKEY